MILDSPVFRAQTKADPYPARMEPRHLVLDLEPGYWGYRPLFPNHRHIPHQRLSRFPRPSLPPAQGYACLLVAPQRRIPGSLPLRTKEEMKKVCSAVNLSKEHCTKYVQFGNTFNLLHAAASCISAPSVLGHATPVSGHSSVWIPDPSDIAAFEENPVKPNDVQADEVAEAARPEHKRHSRVGWYQTGPYSGDLAYRYVASRHRMVL